MIRWFQYGCFCPVMRLHGFRQDKERDPRFGHEFSFGGADNEVWSFGDQAYEILKFYMELRGRLKSYIHETMKSASDTGLPPMRPLFLVAPVTEMNARQKTLYLPGSSDWTNVWDGSTFSGGRMVTVDSPLEQIPIFVQGKSAVIEAFKSRNT